MYNYYDPLLSLGAVGIVVILIALFVAALFLWLAGKLIGIKKASIGRAMLAILGGGVLAVIVGALTALVFAPLAPVLAFIVNLWVIKAAFDTGWLKAFVAWLLAGIIAGIVVVIFAALGLFAVGAMNLL